MAEVTYFVALPFVAADDGIAAGETEPSLPPRAACSILTEILLLVEQSGREWNLSSKAF